jgi:asparagine synthase (glutamine-hydrolysing)
MCGICGVIDKQGRSINPTDIQTMTRQMAHRGPDDAGFFLDGPVGLGHRRLSIIDLKTGHQPMFNEDESVAIVFNGEIYNFAAIKKNLENRGHIFRTHSDTEVIVHAYEEKGLDCLNLFRGMFAFAVYDSKKKELMVARDRLGIKPLYYFQSPDAFVFASEIKAILKSEFYKPSVNLKAIDFYMTLGYTPGADTAFEGIRKLLPGHIGIYKNAGFQTREYWDVNHYGDRSASVLGAKDEFHELLKETVGSHLMSDVPVGVFLSGGLDSSTVVAYMKKYFDCPVRTFSVGYEDDPRSSELRYARIVADYFQTQHFEYNLTPDDFFESLDLFLQYVEEPVVESAGVALFRLAEFARSQGVIVLLSGEGADEILAGYPLYRIMSLIERLKPLTDKLPERVVDCLLGIKFIGEKKLKYHDWLNESLIDRYRTISCDVTESVKQKLYRTDFSNYVDHEVSGFFRNILDKMEGSSDLQKMLYADMKTWLPDDLLIKADKMTMAASIELRVPFLDHKVVEFAASLPDTLKLHGRQGKYLLKQIMKDILPDKIIRRKKMGFPVPISKWFGGSIYEKTREILLDNKTFSRGYFDPEYIMKILDRHKNGAEDSGRRIFSLLALELWHRKYIDR